MKNIASNIINKCGGVARVASWLGVDRSNVYRWTYPKEKRGTGGLVPANHQPELLRKAKEEGIDLSPDDFFNFSEPHHSNHPTYTV